MASLTKASVVVVAHYSGLTVANLQDLRKRMREAGATVQVTKNRLSKIALEGTRRRFDRFPSARDRP